MLFFETDIQEFLFSANECIQPFSENLHEGLMKNNDESAKNPPATNQPITVVESDVSNYGFHVHI